MPPRIRPAAPEDVAAARARLAEAAAAGLPADRADLRLLVKHYLALLEAGAPGRSVEVRVPPYAAVQVIEGVRHTRGTPPAVVELSAETWIALATGDLGWADALGSGRITASGERTDLSPYLPLHRPL